MSIGGMKADSVRGESAAAAVDVNVKKKIAYLFNSESQGSQYQVHANRHYSRRSSHSESCFT